MKKIWLKRLLLAFVLMFVVLLPTTARTCSKCNGSGRMKIFHELSTYGISKDKHQCPICKKWITLGTEHTEICDRCGGSGHVETAVDRRNSVVSSRIDDAAAEGLSYLTPGELAQYQALQDLLKGHRENVECQTCGKTGRCINCNGSGYTLDGNICYLCSSTGKCTVCYGTGVSGSRYVEPSEAEKREILTRMGQIVSSAMDRANGSNNVSSAYDAESDDVNEYTDSTHQKKEDNGWLWMVVFAVVGFFVYKKVKN